MLPRLQAVPLSLLSLYASPTTDTAAASVGPWSGTWQAQEKEEQEINIYADDPKSRTSAQNLLAANQPAAASTDNDTRQLTLAHTFALINNTWQGISLDLSDYSSLKVDIGFYHFKKHFKVLQQRSEASVRYHFGSSSLQLAASYVAPIYQSYNTDLFSLVLKLKHQASEHLGMGAYLGVGRSMFKEDYVRALFIGGILNHDKIYSSIQPASTKVNKLVSYTSINFAFTSRSPKFDDFSLYHSTQLGANINFSGWQATNFGVSFFVPLSLQLLGAYHQRTRTLEFPTLSMRCGIGVRVRYCRTRIFTASYKCEFGVSYVRHSFQILANFGF